MDPLLAVVKKTIRDHDMVMPGQKITVALSGGPDSVALLKILHMLKSQLKITITVCHYDHALRPDSGDDAKFAIKLAESLGLTIITEKRKGKKPTVGIQEKARALRYRFFDKLIGAGFGDRIATGHTLDDTVETSLMWMIRGAGPRAFGGIPPVRENFIRPLIDIEKKRLMEWLGAEGIEYRTDPTNETGMYRRNRIRQNIIPALTSESSGAVASIARLARLTRSQSEVIEELVKNKSEELITAKNEKRILIDLERTANEKEAIRFELYRQLALMVGLSNSALTLERIEEIDRLVTDKKLGKSVQLPGGFIAFADHAGLTIGRKTSSEDDVQVTPFTTPMSISTSAGTLTIEAGEKTGGAVADKTKIPEDAVIRGRLAGDYLSLPRAGGTKKLKKFLIDKKVPKNLRDALPMLADGAEILFIPGVYLAHKIAPDDSTKEPVSFLWRAKGES